MTGEELLNAIAKRSKGVFGRLAKEIDPRDKIKLEWFIKCCLEQSNNILAKDLWGEDLIKEIVRYNAENSADDLTAREIQVLYEVCEDATDAEIAKKLQISGSTVRFHKDNLLKKVKVKGSAGLVKFAIRKGYINLLSCEN